MKVLHLYSDWKWTGPSEPVLQACLELQQRGHDVLIAYRSQQHDAEENVGAKLAALGLRGTSEFALDRYLGIGGTLHDLAALPRFIRREAFDIVHTHLCHDHVLGGLCVRALGRRRPLLVRTLHRRTVLDPTVGYRFQLRHLTDGCLAFTERFRQEYIDRFRLPPARVAVLPMSVDLERFNPARTFRDMRSEFGIAPDAPVIGIVGRFQKYRRMDIFLEAVRLLSAEAPETRFLVIGRSSKMQETVIEPMRKLGVQERVILTGYRIDDYVDIMSSLDLFTLLMPGFDGTARAVREALALAKPCVVSDFGMLPDIVAHDRTGLVVPDKDAESLAHAWLKLVRDPERRLAMGAAARCSAQERFRTELIGPALEDFYERLLSERCIRM